MTTKKRPILIRVQPETVDALRKAALAEGLSMAWIANRATVEWLRRNGYLPGLEKKP